VWRGPASQTDFDEYTTTHQSILRTLDDYILRCQLKSSEGSPAMKTAKIIRLNPLAFRELSVDMIDKLLRWAMVLAGYLPAPPSSWPSLVSIPCGKAPRGSCRFYSRFQRSVAYPTEPSGTSALYAPFLL